MQNRRIILGITGSIAAYKSIDLAKLLIANSYSLDIVLSKSAPKFVPVGTLKAMFPGHVFEHDDDVCESGEMLHISLAKAADYILIAPTSANMLAKLAYGGADCLLSTICLATEAQVILSPAMNKVMWENPFVQKNISALKNGGVHIINPASGVQACGDVGLGRMPEPGEILNFLLDLKTPQVLANNTISQIKECKERGAMPMEIGERRVDDAIFKNGNWYKKVVITAGGTREGLDPVRFLSNYSSGKMGYAIAKMASQMGARVVLISGISTLSPPPNVEFISVVSASDMLLAVKDSVSDADIFIGAAAVADYRPEFFSAKKIKKSTDQMVLNLVKNIDIISYVKQNYPNIFCAGFAAETDDIENYGLKKLKDKNLDLIAINDVFDGKVFGNDYNQLTVITKDGQVVNLDKAHKDLLAKQLLYIISAPSS